MEFGESDSLQTGRERTGVLAFGELGLVERRVEVAVGILMAASDLTTESFESAA